MNVIALTPVVLGTVLAPFSLGIPRLVSELEPMGLNREVNINANRMRLQNIFRDNRFRKYDMVLLMDSDVVIDLDAFDRLVSAWKSGTTACANTKGSFKGHVVTSCALLHRLDYLRVDYCTEPKKCQCSKLPHPFYVDGAVGTEVRL